MHRTTLGVPREAGAHEKRVAIVPETVAKLAELGFDVIVEAGAGAEAGFDDAAYEAAGATVSGPESYREAPAEDPWKADLVVKVSPPSESEAKRLREGATLVSLLQPESNPELMAALEAEKVSAIALDKIPRITRAQKMDVLSSMANLAGYRAVLEGAAAYQGFMGAQVTAAGTDPPAKVLVIGAGVAGLAAIATAHAMGAEVRAFDVRPATAEQVESLGGKFLMLDFEESGEGGGGYAKVMSEEFIEAEMALFREQAREVDLVITTALIPGKKAPTLLPEDVVAELRPGSVVVDLAAAAGGNCVYTKADEVVVHEGVTILGYTDLPSRMAHTASRFFSANVRHLLTDMVGEEGFVLDLEDEVVRAATQIHEGERLPPPPRKEPTPPPKPEPPREAAPRKEPEEESGAGKAVGTMIGAAIAAAAFALVGLFAPEDFVQHFTVFILACFVGWQIVWAVAPALHTPLMSVTNAISGIVLVGGLVQAAPGGSGLPVILGAVALLIGTINVAGGFLVTERMLGMFKKGGPK